MPLALRLLEDRLAVCRLAPDAALPSWAWNAPGLCSVTRTQDEWSVVCAEEVVPPEVQREAGWRVFQVAGPLDFALTGVLLAIVHPLAEAGISVFALATYDTDYVMVRAPGLERALEALRAAGHDVS